MDKTFKQLIEEAKELNLSQDEKTALKTKLLLFTQTHPAVRRADSTRLHNRRSIFNSIKLTLTKPINPMPAIIAILILLSGGVSFAAEQTLPGDALYPIKTHITEEVRGWTAISDQAKANWDATVASRRLAEAEELAAEGRLSSEVRTQLEQNFQAHADRVQQRINTFADRDAGKAAEVISNFETSLRVHEKILVSIGLAKDASTQPETDTLAGRVHKEAQESKKDSDEEDTRVAGQTEVQAAADGRMTAASNKITEVRKFIDRRKNQLGAAATTQAEARLKIADDLWLQGKTKLDAKLYGEAFRLFGQAQGTAQEAKLLVQAKVTFESRSDNQATTTTPSPSSSHGPSRPTVRFSNQTEIKTGDNHNQERGEIQINLGL